MKKNLLFVLCTLLFTPLAFTQTWDGSASTSWDEPSNWTPATVPGAASTVSIPNTVNKPVLNGNVTVGTFSMSLGSALNFNGFTLTASGTFDINGATLNNTSAVTDISITLSGSGFNYFRRNTVADNIVFNIDGTGGFYEAYQYPNTFNGNVTFNVAGTGPFHNCYDDRSIYNGDVVVNRTVPGLTYIFRYGAVAVNGNFSYTNTVGGNSYIHQVGTAVVPISGTINITATGPANPVFSMERVGNLTGGGTISIQNSGLTTILRDTLIVNAFNVNGFTSALTDDFIQNSISGAVNISDAATNLGSFYIRGNVINGNTTYGINSSADFYEAYQLPNTFNGNVVFNVNGAGAFYNCYDDISTFNGNVAINRTLAGPTHIFRYGATTVNGNFSYTNNAGGLTNIHTVGNAVTPITGTFNITCSGAGNGGFVMQKIKNLATGGTVSVQNSGQVIITDDTLNLAAFNINGFTSPNTDDFLRNSIIGTVSISDAATNLGSTYFRGNIIEGNTTFGLNSAASFFEAYQLPNVFNGNIAFNIAGAGEFYSCFDDVSTYNGNVSITRTTAGMTNIFRYGAKIVSGNFSYSNTAGGASAIHTVGAIATPITGTVNITCTGPGNPVFSMQKVNNLATGGTISVQNSGQVSIENDTLALTAFNVNGFSSGGYNDFNSIVINGNINISDGVTNTGATYLRGCIFNGNTIYTQNSGSIFYDAYQRNNIYNGNLSLNRNAGTINFAFDHASRVSQNLVLNSAAGITFSDSLIFVGNTNGTIEQTGIQPIIVPVLVIQKTAGAGVTLNDSVTVTNKATFISGNVNATANTPLIFADNATHAGASDDSHVTGIVNKTGNDAFIFPIGSATTLNAVAMSAPAPASIFTAQYVGKNPALDGYDTSLRAQTLQRISGCEYWDIKRPGGTSNVTLLFNYGNLCSGNMYITDPSKIRIAHWTGALWENLGNGTSSGTITGTVATDAPVINYSPFTFASVDVIVNPLPIQLITFLVRKNRDAADIQWQTTNGQNFSHFEVERSNNGSQFSKIGVVNAISGLALHQYSFRDEVPSNGINFYRIKMIDLNGAFKYSDIETILFDASAVITIFPNPVKDELRILSSKNILSIEITDVSGKLIKRMTANADSRYNLSDLRHGLYLIRVRDEERIQVSKLLVE